MANMEQAGQRVYFDLNDVLRSIWEVCAAYMSVYCIAWENFLFESLLSFSVQRQQVVDMRPAELDYLPCSTPNILLLDTMCVYNTK